MGVRQYDPHKEHLVKTPPLKAAITELAFAIDGYTKQVAEARASLARYEQRAAQYGRQNKGAQESVARLTKQVERHVRIIAELTAAQKWMEQQVFTATQPRQERDDYSDVMPEAHRLEGQRDREQELRSSRV